MNKSFYSCAKEDIPYKGVVKNNNPFSFSGIDKWYITGDTHGNLSRLKFLHGQTNTGIIILGDFGCFCIPNSPYEKAYREKVNKYLIKNNQYLYIVRGNHDGSPEDMPNIILREDINVRNLVLYENGYEHIRYLIDGFTYFFNEHKTLIIGGAYSIDKQFRLEANAFWNPKEQLSLGEMLDISHNVKGQHFNLVLTHTCPISWQPTEAFISLPPKISKVDTSMEEWLEGLSKDITFDHWLWGHYHIEKQLDEHREILYRSIIELPKKI